MEISVILPTYKPGDYIWACLDSLVNQTFSKVDYEVIIILNGCRDPWKNSIQRYIDENMLGMNVKFIQTDQGGVSNARNIGLDVVEGDYIAFIDDDDFVSIEYLEELHKIARPDTISLSYPFAFIDGNLEQIDYPITETYDTMANKGHQLYQKSRKYFSGPCMKLIPKNFIEDRRFDVSFSNGEDSLFMFLISDSFTFVDYTSTKAIYFRRYRDSSAVTTKRSRINKISNSLRLIGALSKIYFRSPLKYNTIFYITRILGSLHCMFV